jgi:hypothetical protein
MVYPKRKEICFSKLERSKAGNPALILISIADKPWKVNQESSAVKPQKFLPLCSL